MGGFLIGVGVAVAMSAGAWATYETFAVPSGDRFDGAEVHLPHEVEYPVYDQFRRGDH
ncbi:hypothetical protein [Roseivivax sp. CAU 1761]